MKHHWLSVAALLSTISLASPVLEYTSPQGAHVFDATGENTELIIPTAPREFASVADYLKFMLTRFDGKPIYDAKGQLVDVIGVWKLYGSPYYVDDMGNKRSVTEPIALTVAGRFGYVVIAGNKYEMLVDPGIPALSSIENVVGLSLYSWRKNCSGAPLGGTGYCITAEPFKHIYLFYQSIGSNANLLGNARVTPATRIDYDVRYQNASGINLPIVNIDTTSPGRHRETIFGKSGLGYAQWGVFGNPFVDPTKIILSSHGSTGPTTSGTTGSALAVFPWSVPY
jgi:hypothetical protein